LTVGTFSRQYSNNNSLDIFSFAHLVHFLDLGPVSIPGHLSLHISLPASNIGLGWGTDYRCVLAFSSTNSTGL
jgi:hypothetical protein